VPAGLVIEGSGALALLGTNSYDGPTVVRGTLRAVPGVGVPAASNLTLDGGIFESLGDVTLSRSVGNGAGQIRWTANGGGLSAYGGTTVVQLNGGTGALVWGSGRFVPDGRPLRLGADTNPDTQTRGVLDFRNGIDLNGADRTIERVQSYAPDSLVRLSGSITNSGAPAGLTILNQSGVIELAGTNTYTGPTWVYGGVLRAQPGQGLPDASTLVLNYAMLELTGNSTFTRSVGGGAGEVQLYGGGFSAHDGTLSIRLNNGTGTVSWGSAGFMQYGYPLYLGVSSSPAYSSAVVADFRNGLDLNGSDGSIYVSDPGLRTGNHSPGTLARISGVISNAGGTPAGLLVGNGTPMQYYGDPGPTLELTAPNTYDGATVVQGAALRAGDGVGLPAASTLFLQDGVYEAAGTTTFQRTLGTGPGQVHFGNTGGFSAASGVLTVQLNGGAGTVSFGQPGFAAYGLIFGSSTAGGRVDFQNSLDLANQVRSVNLWGTPAGGVTARLSGEITNGSGTTGDGGINFNGRGVVELAAANTYAGGTWTYGPTVLATNSTGSATGSGVVVATATYQWTGSEYLVVPGRVGGTGSIGGTVYVYEGRLRAGDLAGQGTLTLNNGLVIYGGYPTGGLEVRIADGSRPSATPGGSTVGVIPNPTSNNFLDVTVGPLVLDGKLIVDGTGTAFTPGTRYSYQLARVGGQDMSTLDVTDQSRFSTIGFDATDFRLSGDASGAVFLSFTPVPEPGLILLIAAAGVGCFRRVKRRPGGAANAPPARGR
jgi:autotransporter-associated beta strand protein